MPKARVQAVPKARVQAVLKARLLAVASVVLLTAGCSPASSTPVPSVAPTTPAATTPAPSAPAATAPCPDGDYLVTSFEGRGEASAAGKGSGGNLAATFASGDFTISSDGSQPMTLDLGAVDAELRFDGVITGMYDGDPGALRLTTTGAQGDAVVKGFGISRSYSVGGLANQLLGPGTTAQVTCDDAVGTAVVVLPDASLTLTRRG